MPPCPAKFPTETLDLNLAMCYAGFAFTNRNPRRMLSLFGPSDYTASIKGKSAIRECGRLSVKGFRTGMMQGRNKGRAGTILL